MTTLVMMKKFKNLLIVCVALGAFLACKKDKYYNDGGKAKAEFSGNMLAYLEAKPIPFDSVAQIIKLAGMENTFKTEDFTFFAPDDDVIKRTIGTVSTGGLNRSLFFAGRDTVKKLADIDSTIWKKYLQRYMFKGVNKLKDYPQIDLNLLSIYPGALYYAYGNTVSSIGVVYNDENSVKYIGYRQLVMSYIPDLSRPDQNLTRNFVSSSDIKPKNGIVHTLSYNGAYFGLDIGEFFNDVYISGLKKN